MEITQQMKDQVQILDQLGNFGTYDYLKAFYEEFYVKKSNLV